MLLKELVPYCLDNASRIVDLIPASAELELQLRLPSNAGYMKSSVDEVTSLDLDRSTLLLAMLGPHAPAQADPATLAPVLGRLEPGARIILLIGWPIDELPYHILLGPLVEARCQVIQAVPVERMTGHDGISCALIVERVEKALPPPPYLDDTWTLHGRDAESGQDDLAGLSIVLRIVNEYVLADLVGRPLRRRLLELADAKVERDAARREIARLEAKLARSEFQLAALESSASLHVGRTIVQGVRHPGRAIISVPRGLASAWRGRTVARKTGRPAGEVIRGQSQNGADEQ